MTQYDVVGTMGTDENTTRQTDYNKPELPHFIYENKADNTKCWQDSEKTDTLYHRWLQ